MDRRAHWKGFSLMQLGIGLLCVLFCLGSGCQQMAKQTATAGNDPELAALAASLSAAEPNNMGAVSADKPAAAAATAKAGPAVAAAPAGKIATAPAAKKTEQTPAAAVKAAAPAAKPTAAPATAKKTEDTAAAVVKKTEAPAPAKRVETATAASPVITPAAVEKPAPVVPEKPATGEGVAGSHAETVPKEAERAKPAGPETIEGGESGTNAEPKETKPEELTAIIIGGKEIVISEPVPLRSMGLRPEFKVATTGLDTTPLAASNTAVQETASSTLPAVGPVATADTESTAAVEGEPIDEGGGGIFHGLLGLGRTAVGYAGEHYIALGSVALATPAVVIFARKRRIFRRLFRRMNLED